MATMISDLPRDLTEEILSRVPLLSMRSVRLTCKKWNNLSKSKSFTKLHICKAKASTKEGESTMIAIIDYDIYLMSVVIVNGIDPSIELQGKLTFLNEQEKISKVFHCNGLLLCILTDDKIVVWKPYLGQTRWIIEPKDSPRPNRICYALGYEDNKNPSSRSYKFLRFEDSYNNKSPRNKLLCYEIYDLDSGLWTTLNVTPPWCISYHASNVSLKGNTYWCIYSEDSFIRYIICFDFTKERFGPLLPLPLSLWDNEYEYVDLSCVREEKLAALFQHSESYPYELEIWITTKD